MPDFGILSQPNFAAAALGGYQAGQALGRQKRLEGALGGVDLSRPETLMPVLQADPDTGMKLYQAAGAVRKQQDGDRARAILPQAVAGEKAAISELWGLDSELAGRLTKQQADFVGDGVKAAGNAAFGLLRMPEAQRAAAWDAAIDTLDETYPNLTQFKGQYSETNLWSVLSQAGMAKDAAEFLSPKYQAMVPGGSLGQTNPYAGPVYNGQAAPEPDGVTPSKGGASPVANARAVATSLFPDIQITDWRRDPNSDLGKANPGSWHNKTAAAIDARPIPGMTFDQYVKRYEDAGYRVIEKRDEVTNPSSHSTGPHWHVVLGDKTSARAGLNAPRVGAERTGAGGVKYRFAGGDPSNKSSWERVGG